ncbi:MAG: DUF2878 family protein [Alphaproteobacteria bacterium]|nr:MAG: DUF2878 family protein [Alphaproteobacteria bacterium]
MRSKYLSVILYLWLYAGWFACVMLGRSGLGVLSPLAPAIGWALFLWAFAPNRRECIILLLLCLGGMMADALFLKLGLIHDPSGAVFPLWLLSLWLLFAPAIWLLARLFSRRLWLAALLGGVVGPLSYKSGEYFGVLTMQGVGAFAAYAVFWAFFLPLAIAWVGRNKVTS